MTSDATNELELLDELLQDAAVVETHESEPCDPVEDVTTVNSGADYEMSAEDVLRQLDSVTLSLDANDSGEVGADTAAEVVLNEAELVNEQISLNESIAATDDGKEDAVAAATPLIEEVDEEDDEEVMVDALEEAPAVATEAHEETMGVRDDSTSGRQPIVVSAETKNDMPLAFVDDESKGSTIVESDDPQPETHADDDGFESPAYATQPIPDVSDEELRDESSVATTPVPVDNPASTEQAVIPEVEESPTPHEACGGSWEAVESPPVVDLRDNVDDALPPPAPMTTAPQPIFTGCLNPAKATSEKADKDNDDEDDDDDSDSDCEDNEATPPPLSLEGAPGDDDEELEVDAAVAKEIQALKINEVTGLQAATEEQPTSHNPLLHALGKVDQASDMYKPTVDDRSKMDEISLGFDDPIEVRSAQIVAAPSAPVTHPESVSVVFGIGYQSLLRKSPDRDGSAGNDDAYSLVGKGPTFYDLDSEVTLSSDVSLSQQRTDPAVDMEDDEFGDIPDGSEAGGVASPTQVETIMKKTRASLATRSAEEAEAALVEELRKATTLEKHHLYDSGPPEATKLETDNALTIKELHSMYKRGLGDQEVRMLDDDADADATTPKPRTDNTMHASSLATMGSMPSLTTHAIAEEVEDDTLNEEDADAVTLNIEREMFVENPLNALHGDDSSDWKEIELLHQVSAPPQSTPSPGSVLSETTAYSKITYAEALQHFLESDDVLLLRDHIVAEEKPPSASCFSCFSRPRLAFSGAIEQRDRFFCVAATKFDPRNAVHVRILQTIYRKLLNTGSRDVPLMGPHWETIGFQGTDPSTDLRGCGVLSLLQMLYVVESHTEFARRFHAVSQHPVRHFPLACALINITLQCLVVLRSGALYKESNKHSSVFDAANALHIAIATQLMKEIQSTSEEIPLVVKRVLDTGRQYPDRTIETHAATKNATEGPSQQPPPQPQLSARKPSSTAGCASSSHAAVEFTEIGLHSVADD